MQPLGLPERAGLINFEERGLQREYLGGREGFFRASGRFLGPDRGPQRGASEADYARCI